MIKNEGACRLGRLLVLVALFCAVLTTAGADLTLQGPSGFMQVPAATTIKAKGIEWGAHVRPFKAPGTGTDHYLTEVAMGFSPIRDFELGVAKAMDSRRGKDDFDPDPTVNLKVRLPQMGGDFKEVALGMLVDTNPNNYHTLYFSVGGCGVGWNFGGNPGSGIAHYGSYDRGRREPKALCLLVGGELYPPKPGERGYRSHYMIDYNGDVFTLGWRFKSHRGFWVDAGVQTKSSYTDTYDYQPLIFGLGGIF